MWVKIEKSSISSTDHTSAPVVRDHTIKDLTIARELVLHPDAKRVLIEYYVYYAYCEVSIFPRLYSMTDMDTAMIECARLFNDDSAAKIAFTANLEEMLGSKSKTHAVHDLTTTIRITVLWSTSAKGFKRLSRLEVGTYEYKRPIYAEHITINSRERGNTRRDSYQSLDLRCESVDEPRKRMNMAYSTLQRQEWAVRRSRS